MSSYLIVVDMQKDFIDGALGTPEAVALVPRVIATIKSHLALGEGPVLFTLDTHDSDYLESIEGRKLPVIHCVEGSEGWELHPLIKLLAEENRCRAFKKPTFGSADLVSYLVEVNEQDPISSIELVGLCTDICVISNALLIKASLPNVPILVDSTCCAGVTQESHENALSAMQMCHIDII